jgi:hypothetical protein|tara:strand:+ start:150 stop:326 length:177 start_codon:yes stop_codon:yes gene_type:complete
MEDRVYATQFLDDDPRVVLGPFIQTKTYKEAQTVAEHYGLIIVGEVTDFVPKEEIILH